LKKHNDPRQLAIALLSRSICSIAVSAVLADSYGVHAWGWNSSGLTGYGEHAEAHCLRRANRSRLSGSTMYITSRRARNGKMLNSRPCMECQKLIRCVGSIVYLDKSGWRMM
jgi:pyrimidine deaminase RibD-like protein